MKELYADKKKAAQMLVTSIGSSNYNTLAALVAPQKPTDIEYDKLISILGKHLSPERNMLVAQHLFLSEVQSNKQSITEYVATLQQNLSACKFRYKCTCEVDVSIADVFLRAQFIRGLKDSWITEQILQSDLIDFNQIVQKAIALEAARADSKTITKADASTSSIHSTQIDKVSTQRHSRGKSNSMQNRSRSKSSFRNRSASSNQNQGTNRDNFNRQTNIDYRELGIDNLCFRCGRDNHRANECYANRDNLKCKHCNKSGHVAKVCVTTLLRNKNSFKSVNTNSINQVTSSYDSNQVIDVFDNKCEPDRDARKYFISVSVEGHNLTFEVDSGAGFTLIPKYLFDKLGINCKLDQANVLFRAYTHQIFRPYGKITVNVQYRNSRSTEDMYVVPNHLDPLLGRVWIRHLKINLEEVDADSFHNNSCPINKITNVNDIRTQEETCKDRELQEIIEELSSTSKDSSFTIDHGILFRDQRVVIPKSMQNEILQELHVTHLGVTKMKQLSRRYCFWKGIDKDIESFVKACPECIKIKHSASKVPLHHWEMPNENWDRIHIDYAGPIGNQHFLVVVDAKSKWAEVRVLNDSPNSLNSIELLNGIFSTHGYPKQIVSDNATIFTSKQFSHYCRDHGIRQKFIAPGHPATNGLAERNVQTLKRRLESMRNEKSSISVKLQTILLRYRATPLIDGKSPAENYLHRRVRIRLDAIRPYFEGSSSSATPPVRSLQEKERVIAKCFANNKIIWKPGTVLKKFGKLHYLVELDDGYKFKRHIDQLQKSGLKSVKFQDPPEPRCQKQDEEDTSKGLHFPQDEHSHYQTMLDATRQDVPVLDTPVPDVQVSVPELRRSKRDIRPPAKLTDYVLQ
ncbi:hypothetical protein PPYR_13357 [Photinus pyralis]|uniref:RNA-directed DNA polymerase n=1 Tax=Photinus pyralis TaxID=7054 RepID=A0A5N4A8V2_PHOPY|nr:hypothetical protein PPYR_13357 [Photinus pyralis]